MKRNVLVMALVVVMTMLLTACGGGGTPAGNQPAAKGAKQQPLIIKFGHVNADSHPIGIVTQEFAKEIAQKIPEIKVEMHGNSVLGGEREMAESIQLGTLEMAALGIAGTRIYDDVSTIFYLPYLFQSREAAFKVMDGEIAKKLFSKFENAGVIYLGAYENGYRPLTTKNTVVKTPADMKGLKIRAPEIDIAIDAFNAMGANATSMSFSELFTAMQQGTVDGQDNPLITVKTSSFYEVQKNVSLINWCWAPFPIVMNLSTWNKITPENQVIFKQALQNAINKQRQLNIEADKTLVVELEKLGMTITEPDIEAFRAATASVYEKYAKKFDPKLVEEIRAVK